MIRAMNKMDLPELKAIHEKFYKTEFNFPDFMKNFLCTFVIVDDTTNDIILGGGVKLIAESVLITNKNYPPRIRKDALLTARDISMYFINRAELEGLHAFVQDEQWLRQLKKYGFRSTKGTPVIYG